MQNPPIIKIGEIMFVFTMPFPPGSVNDLIPPKHVFVGEAEVYPVPKNNYFAYTLILPSRLSPSDRGEQHRRQQIEAALDYIWRELTERGHVVGPRPEVIDGDPVKMTH